MKSFIREVNRNTGPLKRIMLMFLALFSPGDLLLCVIKGFSEAFDDLSDKEMFELFHESQQDLY